MKLDPKAIETAAQFIESAEAIMIGAGAGMGVDSGLPDFRGTEGFWRAYPQLEQLGVSFEEMANPQWFEKNPRLAWGFYGHRFELYQRTQPHSGFSFINRWINEKKLDYFIFTSNVDGHFQKGGFDSEKILECHGSLLHLQCLRNCGHPIWRTDSSLVFRINPDNLLAESPLPNCSECGSIARPNILMFSDFQWDSNRTLNQERKYQDWLKNQKSKRLVVLEIGAGIDVPTVRLNCEEVYRMIGDHYIRINPRESEIAYEEAVSLPMKAEEAIKAINQKII